MLLLVHILGDAPPASKPRTFPEALTIRVKTQKIGLKHNFDLHLSVDDENVWEWTDGSSWDYNKWNPGKPENPNNGYVLFDNNGGWFDQKKNLKRKFICQCDAI